MIICYDSFLLNMVYEFNQPDCYLPESFLIIFLKIFLQKRSEKFKLKQKIIASFQLLSTGSIIFNKTQQKLMLANLNSILPTFRQQTSKQLMSQPSINGIDIVFQDIRYSVDVPDDTVETKIPCKKAYKKKQILKGLSGILKAGQVTAIMGASGAGKTTLLNILACRIAPELGGKLYANNLEYDYQTFGDFANYVMQTDVLMQTLTVRETLEFAAKLKLNLPQNQRKQRVNMIARQMKLQKCIDTLVGGVILKGVSGGEKKRTSIAFQLMSDPHVIFLDQPTSGLDSLTSYVICSELKKLSHNRNKTVIMTIHQPNSQIYQLFDELLLLLEGRLIYHNKATDASNYFRNSFNLICPEFANPPDFFMSKIHHEDQKNVKRYPEYFEAYQKHQKQDVQIKITKKLTNQVTLRQVNVGFTTAFSALIYRNFLNIIRNPMLFKSKLFQSIFMALFVGGLYFDIGTHDYNLKPFWNSITGFLFFLTINALMTTLSPITLTFPLERDVFFKQQDSKMYKVGSYFLARNIVQLPEMAFIPLVFVCINYFMIDMANTAGQFFLHYLVFFLIAFCGSSLGLLLGSVIMDAKSVSAVVPVLVLPIILFSGFFKNRGQLPKWLGWIEYISPNKYGFIGFLENEVAFKSSRVEQFNFDVTKWEAILILFCLGIAFRILSFIFLWLLKRKTQ